MAPRSARAHLTTLVSVAIVTALVACTGGDEAGDPDRFCAEIEESRKVLTRPEIASADDPERAIDDLLADYERIGAYAPLAVETEWDQLVAAYQAADDVVPGDAQSEQAALEAIFRAEKAAVAINDWVRENCGFRVGPVVTIVGEPATTVGPSTTDAP